MQLAGSGCMYVHGPRVGQIQLQSESLVLLRHSRPLQRFDHSSGGSNMELPIRSKGSCMPRQFNHVHVIS